MVGSRHLCYFLLFVCMLVFGQAKKDFIVILDWLINPDHAPLFIAEQEGFFKEQGLNVKLIRPPDLNNPLRLLISKKADLAVDYQPQALVAMDAGLPLKQVGTLIPSPLNCLVVLKKSGIKSVKDLSGKKIGYAMSGVDTALIKGMLMHAGVDLSTVNLIHIPTGLTQALLTGQVDAITGVMRQFELTKLKFSGHAAVGFYPENNGIPPYSELIFVANKDHMDKAQIERFLKAVKKGMAYIDKHPERSWREFAEQHKVLDTPMIKETWFKTLPLFTRNPDRVDKEQCKKVAHYLKLDIKKVCEN